MSDFLLMANVLSWQFSGNPAQQGMNGHHG